jgi:hypothetical protein
LNLSLDTAAKVAIFGSGNEEMERRATEVMARTNIHYLVMGGDAGEALKPITANTPGEMFNAVKNFLGASKSASVSLQNPGVPIAYTLKYLASNRVARLSDFVDYTKKDCTLIPRQPPQLPPWQPVVNIGPFGGIWGDWGDMSVCPPYQYAYLFSKKVEARQGNGDDTALNAIGLDCAPIADRGNRTSITSTQGPWGGWDPQSWCAQGQYITGARLRIEPRQGGGDDTGAVDVMFRCSDGQEITTPTALTWGDWKDWQDCPSGSAIAGIQTKVEARQGHGDDTALNDAVFACYPVVP